VFLSAEQALADYAVLVRALKEKWNSWDSAVIAFGGSYGGMLSSWFRMKYPTWVDGSIAASAPIEAFMGLVPPVNDNFFAQIETYDCTAQGGSNNMCSQNYHTSWNIIFDMAQTPSGRQQLQEAFRLCTLPKTPDSGYEIANWISNAIADMAMGSYPYPSSYMLMGEGTLPAFPLMLGCNTYLAKNFGSNNMALLEAIRDAVGIYYNYTQELTCYDLDNNGETRQTLTVHYGTICIARS